MSRLGAPTFYRRLLIASIVFGLLILSQFVLFGWLIFRSLSQREIDRILLETREEAKGLAQQLANRAGAQGKDLYTAIAVEHVTQTYIDDFLSRRDVVARVEIRDKDGNLVFKGTNNFSGTVVPPSQGAVAPPGTPGGSPGDRDTPPRVASPSPREVPPSSRDAPLQTTQVTTTEVSTYDVTEPIGDLGLVRIALSRAQLKHSVATLRSDLVRQVIWIAGVSLAVLLSAYVIIWLLLWRARRLEKQAAEAESMAYIGTLASGLAHEIRNPLNSLNLNMQLLEEEIGERSSMPSSRRLLAITRSEISRLERLATDFLSYARPRPPEREEIEPGALFARTLEVLAGEIQARGARMTIDDRSGGARLQVDPAQMRQLLLNLAQNALAATEETGRPPLVTLRALHEGHRVVLEVEDNGAGIPSEDRQRIFDIFYSTRKGGTGLGLAIVARIAKAHGGEIEVDGTPAGTRVRVSLPAEPAPAAEPAAEPTMSRPRIA